jgi:hypothetical protein
MALNFYRSDGWVKLVSGVAVPGAQVYILNQPANVTPPITPPRTLPVPFTPNPQVQVYSDAGFTPVVQPIITDGFGHYDFYALPGLYTIAIYTGGKLSQFYIDQTVGNIGSSGGTSVLLSTNGSPNFNQTALNLTQGANIVIANDNFGNTTISAVVPSPSRTSAIFYTIDGGGSVLGTGAKGQLNIPVNCTVTGWVLTADQSGSAVLDVLRSTYGAFPTTVTIANTDKPTLSSAQKNENLGPLNNWTSTALLVGDQLQFNVNSAVTVTRLNLTLVITIP